MTLKKKKNTHTISPYATTIYLPFSILVSVNIEHFITAVHHHPELSLWVKSNVQWAVRQGKDTVWYKLVFNHQLESKKLDCGYSVDNKSNRSSFWCGPLRLWVDALKTRPLNNVSTAGKINTTIIMCINL